LSPVERQGFFVLYTPQQTLPYLLPPPHRRHNSFLVPPHVSLTATIPGRCSRSSGNTFLVTEKEYDNFILEMDIRTEDTSSNSGVQTRSHYNPAGHEGKGTVYGRQFEIDPSSRRWSGGIYDEGRRDWLYPASLNSSAQNVFKPGQYNHIRIECIGNSIKTWLNGTAIASLIDTIDDKGFIGRREERRLATPLRRKDLTGMGSRL
jgi:hypothetical protein